MIIAKEKLGEMIDGIMNSKNCPLCEAQIQYELALKLNAEDSDMRVFLEYPAKVKDTETQRRIYYDLVIVKDGTYYAIELKYKTKKGIVTFDGKDYDLSQQGAQDLGRYDFLKDVSRIENFENYTEKEFGGGYAVMITNDSGYWNTNGGNYLYKDFALCDNTEILKGDKSWAWKDEPKEKTVGKSRINGLTLKNDYTINWKSVNDKFRQLILEIKK